MDLSIMKLLEEEEDETMHSGADVDAFTAALNRDIEGDTSSSKPPFDSDTSGTATLFQDGNQTSGQLYSQWQPSSQKENGDTQSQQVSQIMGQQTSELVASQLGSDEVNMQLEVNASQMQGDFTVLQKQTHEFAQELKAEPSSSDFHPSSSMQASVSSAGRIQQPENMQSNAQFANMQAFRSQPTPVQEQPIAPLNRSRQIPFGSLLPMILPELDKDRAMQLQALYNKLRKNEVSKENFVRTMRGLVGDQMLKLAAFKMQAKSARIVHATASQLQPQNAIHQPQVRPASVSSGQFSDPYPFQQPHRIGQGTPSDLSSGHSLTMQVQKDSSHTLLEDNALRSREMEPLIDSHAMQVSRIPDHVSNPIQGLNKIQQQHLHFAQNRLPMHGSSSDHSSATNVNLPAKLVKHPHDIRMRQVQHHQGLGLTNGGAPTSSMTSIPKLEKQNVLSDPKKVSDGSFSQRAINVAMQQESAVWQAPVGNEQKSGSLSSGPYLKREPVDLTNDHHLKASSTSSQGATSFGPLVHEQGNAFSGASNIELSEREASKMAFSASMSTPLNYSSVATPLNSSSQVSSQMPSTSAITGAATTLKSPAKKPSVGQKKTLDTHGSSPPPSKKQKVSGVSLDQSIEHLNDVTAVSGVNLREEEEQLFSGPKDESRISEASRRAVQEEEERLILQKIPLQKKLAEIISRCGLKNLSNDVEQCLSLCVEERLRGLISNLIRVSKQRVDSEKSRHRTIVTSDVREQILTINHKAREEWEKKQAESAKLRKLSEPEISSGVESDKEKDEGRGRMVKNVPANKDEDDKMRTTAANVAARAAVGGDDMLSKWQMMAEQVKQKREGGTENASSSQATKDAIHRPLTTSVKNQGDNNGGGKRDSPAAIAASGAVRQLGRNQAAILPQKVARSISVRDVIAVLEKETQVRKTTVLYRLYERGRGEPTGE